VSGQVVESDHVLKSNHVLKSDRVVGQASYFGRLAGSGFVCRSLHTPCLSLGTGHLGSCEAAKFGHPHAASSLSDWYGLASRAGGLRWRLFVEYLLEWCWLTLLMSVPSVAVEISLI